MVYYMGDIHGNPLPAVFACRQMNMTHEDTLVLLGDVGANYYGDERDARTKKSLAKLGPKILCIHGNHEMRPESITSYSSKVWRGGKVWYVPIVWTNNTGWKEDIVGGLTSSLRKKSKRRWHRPWTRSIGKLMLFSRIPVPSGMNRARHFFLLLISPQWMTRPKSGSILSRRSSHISIGFVVTGTLRSTSIR